MKTQDTYRGDSVSPRLRFALIGAGGIAQAYAQAFAQSECCELVAVADVRSEAAQALAEITGGKAYDDYKTLAGNETLDAVIVATPPKSHPEIACYFLERGTPVLCEKPLCLTVAEAETMISTAEKSNVLFTMASKFRYCDDVIKAKGIVASGILGDVIQFENAFTAKVDMSKRWNSDAEISGGGVLIDNGTHSVDIIRYFLGPIDAVLAVDAGGTQDLAVDENVKMFAKTKNGVTASVDLTWGINKELPYFISIYGNGGTLHIGWRESKYKLNSSPDWTVFGSGYDKVASFKGKIENFSKTLRGREDLLIKPADALASVQVIEAAYKSLKQNLWQPVIELNNVAAR
ncbi:MAG: Gfo/Idh/MocA family oxidoreductase [Acidobacteria bacterium]|nr:Gfo/Idh/MocA family oxidoreductase [Acidobacteriota bacterium]MBK8151021.1 Gfo/Idh/MocA family oxidoreductase [Acidobacteriota bacterium]MBK8813662.1 Gfo/Idh/MocA family oxidoreductase [Acidobacteriota bacterium]